LDNLTAAPKVFAFEIGSKVIEIPIVMTLMTWIVMAVLVLFGYLAAKNLKNVPGPLQNIAEMLIDFLNDITKSALGKDAKKYFPFIFTLFMFVLLANTIGVIPNIIKVIGSIIAIVHNIFGSDAVTLTVNGFTSFNLDVAQNVWYGFLLNFPDFQEPTRSINTCLALATVTFIHVHSYGIKNKGLFGYFGDYMDPLPGKMPYILFFWINPFFYLNIIGAVSNLVSHSFRLFGNMFGGFMIIAIVSSLINYVLAPVGLMAFFGLFAGLVQAFVFTMLAVTYIAQQN